MRPLVPVLLSLFLATPALAGFDVSSYKKQSRSGASDHDAAAAVDGNPATAWMVDPEAKNEGSWIYIDVPLGKVDKLSFVVGWAQDDSTWQDYARLKKARIEVIDLDSGQEVVVHKQDASFDDKQDRQLIDLPDPRVGGEWQGGRVRVTVLEVYPGKNYDYLALGEVLVHMGEFDATVVNLARPPESSAASNPPENMVDGNARTFWAAASKDDEVAFEVDGGKFSVSQLGIVPGPRSHARPKVVEVTQSNVTRKHTLPDKAGTHWLPLPALVGYTGSAFGPVSVKVIEVYAGSGNNGVAITDIKFKATALDML